MNELQDKLKLLFEKCSIPTKKDLKSLLQKTLKVLQAEDSLIRPQNDDGISGGMIEILQDVPVILVPDLHARYASFYQFLNYKLSFEDEKLSVLDALEQQRIVVICVGDALHAEKRAKERWLLALNDLYIDNKKTSAALKEEMSEGLTLVSMIFELKCAFQNNFHFLKGNHENITNTSDFGNHSFAKFGFEGEMTYDFMLQRYDESIVELYKNVENALPLFVKGKNFLCSHAEPKDFYSKTEIINSYKNFELIEGLTWTANDAATEGSVEKMLAEYTQSDESFYFAGHRPVLNENYKLRANGRFVQFHNPDKMNIVLLQPNKKFNPDLDILLVDKSVE